MTSHWRFHGSIPSEHRHNGRRNILRHVLAPTVQRAIELVLAAEPGCTVHSVQHMGVMDIIDSEPVRSALRDAAP